MTAGAPTLDEWIDVQWGRAASGMLMSVSPVGLVKRRPGFGQSVHPRRGAIVASPVLADWDPDPDYFFHWFRDSALVVDALRRLFESGSLKREALGHLADFIRFSGALSHLDGRLTAASRVWREAVAPQFVRFLRTDAELATVFGEAVVAETRVNADGTLDFSSWTRPQHDGAALRALALMRWSPHVDAAERHGQPDFPPAGRPKLSEDLAQLVRADLAFTFAHWREPCFDIWEEEQGLHYFTLCVSAAALEEGARWLALRDERSLAHSYGCEAQAIRKQLEEFWLAEAGYFRSRVLSSGTRSNKELDIAVILAGIHAGGEGALHTVHDRRMHATLRQLESLFDATYPINHARPSERAPAMGRYPGDVYFSGGAYYFATLGAAEFCFLAAAGAVDAADAVEWIERGERYLRTVRAFTPSDGQLSEQFDQRTGKQTSARHLAWSYAAFISCICARRTALARVT